MSARIVGIRIFWLLLSVALSLAVAACSSEEPKKPATPPAARPQAQPRSQPPAAPAPQAPAAQESQGAQATPSVSSGKPAGESTAQASMAPTGDVVEVRRSWVQVRNRPSQDARAIALVFGNDRLPVVAQEGEWVRVKVQGNVEGWIPLATTQEP